MPSDLILFARLSHYGAVVFLGLAALCAFFPARKKALVMLAGALALFALFLGIRAWLKQFFPFTDKTESFVTLALMLAAFSGRYHKKLSSMEFSIMLLLSALWAATALAFRTQIRFPTPYLRTIWYPLHVPLSFASYALWFMAGLGSLLHLVKRKSIGSPGKPEDFTAALCRNGFILFTLSMIFGGIWGYLAWGAYFLWDPKLVWSVILWFYYGSLLHIDKLPVFKKWQDPLMVLGVFLILITFVGTGFFTSSIHKF